MRKVSTQLLAKLQAGKLVCFTVLDMDIDGTWYRYTDCDVPLVIDEHIYTPAPFKPGTVKHGANSSLSSFGFKISTQMSGLQTAFQDGTPRGGTVIARLVFLNVNYYAAYASNVLTNPGIESGVLGDWHLHVGAGATASAAAQGSGAYKGTYCAKITITDGWGDATHVKDIIFQQHVAAAIESGILYDFTFAAKAAATRKIAADIGVEAGQDYPMFYNIDLTTSWKFFILPYISGYALGAGTAAVNFYLARSDSNDDVFIDQVRFSNSLYPITVFRGYLDKWSLDEEWMDIRVVSALAAWTQRVVRRQSSTCRWLKFKGVECQYAGAETWCDRTYSRCDTLTNTANFGGFRWLPSIMGKKIFWGSFPAGPIIAVQHNDPGHVGTPFIHGYYL